MTYSSAISKRDDEDLMIAQLQKVSFVLIEKAKVNAEHEILEIGCGWGTLAIEVVKRTVCKFTGITLSEEQLTFAEWGVLEAELQWYQSYCELDFVLCGVIDGIKVLSS